MALLSGHLLIALAVTLFLNKLNKFYPLATLWLKGLEFVLPPNKQELQQLKPKLSKPKNKRRSKRVKRNKQASVNIKLYGISWELLTLHPFYDTLENLIIVCICAIANILASEFFYLVSYFLSGKTDLNNNYVSVAILCFIFLTIKYMISIIKATGFNSYETRISVVSGILAFTTSYVILESRKSPDYFDFNYKSSYAALASSLTASLDDSVEFPIKITRPIFSLFLSAFCGLLGFSLFLPVIRIAKCHYGLQKDADRSPLIKWLSTISFWFPLVLALTWVKAVNREIIDLQYWRENEFVGYLGAVKVELAVVYFAISLFMFRPYAQAFLDLALDYASELLKTDKDKETICTKISSVYYCICLVGVELFAPALLVFFFHTLYYLKGNVDLGIESNVFGITDMRSGGNVLDAAIPAIFFHDLFGFLSFFCSAFTFILLAFGLIYVRATK
eukprot:TRINITY_DN9725_c0_g1_i1.p1 TRINITY_DN9725_c0_g1~~TRINITY_DN9725_c0_g1_i1.p1  ORF type:complete len:448 (+),score=61.20 TRINITY_DN9725_c0_g1_i1:39-1382(+)